jgi:hypothetical protein
MGRRQGRKVGLKRTKIRKLASILPHLKLRSLIEKMTPLLSSSVLSSLLKLGWWQSRSQVNLRRDSKRSNRSKEMRLLFLSI